MRFSTSWMTPVVRHVSNGIKKSQNLGLRFANFIRSQMMVKIADREKPESEFAQAAFFSCLFSFRVPSETLQLRRAFSPD